MKKILAFIILTITLFSNYIITNAEEDEENKSSFTFESDYKLYEERVANICSPYEYIEWTKDKIKFITTIKDEYPEITNENTYFLPEIKNTHRNNMNNIYKCALLLVQKKALLLINNDLTKENASLAKKISPKIDEKVNKIKLSFKSFDCIDSKEEDSMQKLNVLRQATYQTCKYISYLEYVKETNKQLKNIAPKERDKFYIWEIIERELERETELDNEIEHTYRVFPLAFHAYTEYENNITIHFLLELIKEDYISLRQKLHSALNPINQVVYKISNAMKK